ncbi:gliding motility-associated C-terminal domain-containing protein [Mucilaginibacter flavus]|uniref:T9SS type B sorting domain-containing protein n=1 Tax=Mucilaginibacter flavus TaxID=931504 RepID=UPI0025B55B83|nr:gliding motility-associated C-terminal domain-containing protein [Mucilaginibacter flavus]MDN3582951.1 gliding motility-associated C-terminal domain-containing protein [Mucilaginibacter flavus]
MRLYFLLVFICLFAFDAFDVKAQVGDAIFSIDFGAGANRIGPQIDNSDFKTTYSYYPGTPQDGSYTIANSTQGMYTGAWLVTGDHTGNPGGYMMVVGANEIPDEFFNQRIRGLCPNTKYQFSAYLLNLMQFDGIKPDITFSVTTTGGTITNPTGPINNGLGWRQYSITFTTPSTGGDIILKMTNNAGGGYGNDIALDDITFSPYGPTLTPVFDNNTTSFTACAGDSKTFSLNAQLASDYRYTNPAYQWQINDGSGWADIPGATTQSYLATQPVAAGIYQYRLTSAEAINIGSGPCRVVSQPLTLTVKQPPQAIATATTPVCYGEKLNLFASAGDSYIWTGPGGYTSNQQNPVIEAGSVLSGTYQVAITTGGCTSTSNVDVELNPKLNPNAGENVSICPGGGITLHATGGTKFLWSPATGLSDVNTATPFAMPDTTTTYTVMVTSNGCIARASVTVTVIKDPIADAGPDKQITLGQSTRLDGTASGSNVAYYWTPADYLDDPTKINPIASPTGDITYTLHITSGAPCVVTKTDQVFVSVYKKVIVPNSFSPNNDGFNDTWNIEALYTFPESTIQVFSRYGNIVYQSKGYAKPWDGNTAKGKLPAGTYYYRIDLKNGTTLSGWVEILL